MTCSKESPAPLAATAGYFRALMTEPEIVTLLNIATGESFKINVPSSSSAPSSAPLALQNGVEFATHVRSSSSASTSKASGARASEDAEPEIVEPSHSGARASEIGKEHKQLFTMEIDDVSYFVGGEAKFDDGKIEWQVDPSSALFKGVEVMKLKIMQGKKQFIYNTEAKTSSTFSRKIATATWNNSDQGCTLAITATKFQMPQRGTNIFFSPGHFRDALKLGEQQL